MDKRLRTGGFALPVAVFALVILGILVTGGFYTVRQEMWIGAASVDGQKAFYLAEQGVGNTLDSWSTGTFHEERKLEQRDCGGHRQGWILDGRGDADDQQALLHRVDRDGHEWGCPRVGSDPAGGYDRTSFYG